MIKSVNYLAWLLITNLEPNDVDCQFVLNIQKFLDHIFLTMEVEGYDKTALID